MSDTINRRDAINALDCDITITGKENADVVVKTIQMFVDRIKALPPAQTIIRCKDCYYHPACPHEQYLGLDGFCSHAEERGA